MQQRQAVRKLSVLVCSDDPVTRRAVSSGVSAPDIAIVAETDLSHAAKTLAARLEPDVAVLDVQVPAKRALGTIQRITERAPATRVLACDAVVAAEFGLLCLVAGASGYVSKEIELTAMPRLVRCLAGGEAVIPRGLATELAERFVSLSVRPRSRTRGGLSGPENQVLELLRERSSLSEVAADLGIGLATAQRHLGSARRKLCAQRGGPRRGTTSLRGLHATTDQEVQ